MAGGVPDVRPFNINYRMNARPYSDVPDSTGGPNLENLTEEERSKCDGSSKSESTVVHGCVWQVLVFTHGLSRCYNYEYGLSVCRKSSNKSNVDWSKIYRSRALGCVTLIN